MENVKVGIMTNVISRLAAWQWDTPNSSWSISSSNSGLVLSLRDGNSRIDAELTSAQIAFAKFDILESEVNTSIKMLAEAVA